MHVQVYVDNAAAMGCLNKLGSSKSNKLNNLTKEAWEWCIKRNIWLSVARIAGSENVEAVYESRHVNVDTEWRIDRELLLASLSILKVAPTIDLFASRLNHQFDHYVSYRPAIDAFTLYWGEYNFFAFPPFSLLTRVLQKIKKDAATGVIVAPLWPTQPFYQLLIKMLTHNPVLLSSRKKLEGT